MERPNRRGSNCQIEGPLIRSRGVRVICCFQYFHLKGTLICQIYFFVAACCSDLGGRSDVGFSEIRQPGLSLPNRAAMVWGKRSWLDIWRLEIAGSEPACFLIRDTKNMKTQKKGIDFRLPLLDAVPRPGLWGCGGDYADVPAAPGGAQRSCARCRSCLCVGLSTSEWFLMFSRYLCYNML